MAASRASIASRSARRLRTESPTTTGISVKIRKNPRSNAVGSRPAGVPNRRPPSVTIAGIATATRMIVRRLRSAATVNRPNQIRKTPRCGGLPVPNCAAWSTSTMSNAGTGTTRRKQITTAASAEST